MRDILPHPFTSYTSYTSTLVSFLRKFNFLFDFSNNDTHVFTDRVVLFFLENHWNRIPKEWRDCLLQVKMENLVLMATTGYTEPSWPKSLQEFVKTAHSLRLSLSQDVQKEELNHVLSCGMKEKKKYEVERLAHLIATTAQETKSSMVVDIGSGQGFLSHVLAAKYKLNVVGIDYNSHVSEKANVRKEKLEYKMKQAEIDFTSITSCLSLDLNVNDFIKLLEPVSKKKENMVLVGLHACGDLSATMLKLFVRSDMKGLVNVGCCYHKVTEDNQQKGSAGFPLSNFLRQKENFIVLSTCGLTLGCLALTRWDNEGMENSHYQFKLRSYRTALEYFLHTRLKSIKCPPVFYIGRVSKKKCTTFSSYSIAAIQRMLTRKRNVPFDEISLKFLNSPKLAEELEQFYKQFDPLPDGRIKSIECFLCIRAVLAPLIEALILMDRVIYLNEHKNVSASLIRAFDAKISPRGLVIIAKKTS